MLSPRRSIKMQKRIWIENLVLLNSCVQKDGNILEILGNSYTDPEDGGVTVEVQHPPLSHAQEEIYQKQRFVREW